MSVDAPLLEIDGLVVEVRSAAGARRVVDEVDLVVRPGEPMGLVGESGSGKSVILRAIMGLLPRNLHVVSGSIKLRGVDVLPVGRRGRYRAEVRGRGVSMIFQEPSLALHPVLKVGRQICDSLIASGDLSRRDAWARAVDLMEQVGIADAEHRAHSYPFELSGGMRQRVMIAAAIAPSPDLLLCDEPTTALDVTIQAQVVSLLARLQKDAGLGMLYVTHDLAVASQLCTGLTVLREGRVVERGRLRDVFDDPQHDYTRTLLSAAARIDRPPPMSAPLTTQVQA